MERLVRIPRLEWQPKVEALGLTFHHTYKPGQEPGVYWDESAAYVLTAREVDELERATNELQQMCLAAAQHIIDNDRFSQLAIPAPAIPWVKSTWDEEPPSIYGRFDLSYDGQSPPKLLEYNADTPTALLEAAVVQWCWHEELNIWRDQFNSVHDKLLAKWKDVAPYIKGKKVHFAHVDNRDTEDLMTTMYMRDLAMQAGLRTESILIEQIGWNPDEGCFVDLTDEPIETIFKLYPWEWIFNDPFGAQVASTYGKMQWIEPIWKMLLSNKGILPILWELYPGHPNLLPAYFDGPRDMAEFAVKPLLGREGANVRLVMRDGEVENPGEYGSEGFVYQELHRPPEFDGNHPVIGSWVIDQEAAGIGIRESRGLIIDNLSRFIPHYFEP
jgi:glutathionylspermidine synthase